MTSKKKWRLAAQPTSVAFLRVLCAGDGSVYAAGQGGILYKGRAGTWSLVEQTDSEEDIQDLEWFGGRLWLSTTQNLYTLDGTKLQPVDFDEDLPETFYHLSAADGLLWSIGAKDVMQYDGTAWTRIL